MKGTKTSFIGERASLARGHYGASTNLRKEAM